MFQNQYSVNTDGLMPSEKRFTPIDRLIQNQQNTGVIFNQVTGFSSPRQIGKQAALFAAIRLHYPCCTFSNGKQGRETLCLLVRFASLLTRLLFPAHTFSSVKAGLKNQIEKVYLIMSKIRKGYSRPLITQSIRNFSTLAEAARFVDRMSASHAAVYRFNIQQSDVNRWNVARIVSGGVA